MQNSHCSLIAHRLAEGGIVDERWLWSHHIRNQHKRMAVISMAIIDVTIAGNPVHPIQVPGPFHPIQNIGSTDGHPVKSGGKTTRCGRYYLPSRFRPALRKAIKKMKW